jgi:hypothetical protein
MVNASRPVTMQSENDILQYLSMSHTRLSLSDIAFSISCSAVFIVTKCVYHFGTKSVLQRFVSFERLEALFDRRGQSGNNTQL